MEKSTKKAKYCRTLHYSAGADPKINCPPYMTDKVKKRLEAEIKEFGKRKRRTAKLDAELSSNGSESVDAYHSWVSLHGGRELPEANPDVLSDEEGINYFPSAGDSEEACLLEEVRQLFNPRELQAWNLVMRHGMSLSEAAELLKISKSAVQSYLKRAKLKFTQYMEDKRDARQD